MINLSILKSLWPTRCSESPKFPTPVYIQKHEITPDDEAYEREFVQTKYYLIFKKRMENRIIDLMEDYSIAGELTKEKIEEDKDILQHYLNYVSEDSEAE